MLLLYRVWRACARQARVHVSASRGRTFARMWYGSVVAGGRHCRRLLSRQEREAERRLQLQRGDQGRRQGQGGATNIAHTAL